MKIEPRQAASFLRAPVTFRAVLLHGDDEGLIRERAATLIQQAVGSLSDPFRNVELDRSGWTKLADEMTALSMIGGRRAVRVRDATDAILENLKAALHTAGDALVVLEAPELAKGKLRSFMEAGSDVASLACYPEEGALLQDTIRKYLATRGVSIDAEAVSWLAEALGGARGALNAALDKLALLAGAGGKVTLEAAILGAGDAATSSADAGLVAATQGAVIACDKDLDLAMAEGLAGVALIRAALSYLLKLHQAKLRMNAGMSASDAVRAMRPPVFFKLNAAMTRSLSLWTSDMLDRAVEEARQVEIACKQTGSRPELLARRFVSILARQAHARVRKNL